LLQPLVACWLRAHGIEVGSACKFYGKPHLHRHRNSRIVLGDYVENRNWPFCNAVGIAHATILTTLAEGARLIVGDHVGISGGAIAAMELVRIGAYTLVGADCLIADNDFHPVAAENRRYSRENIGVAPINIGRNVFIGARSVILKGTSIGDDSIVAAGSIVRGTFPPRSLIAGNPARLVKRFDETIENGQA
jgi:acetyltransferase-like isoleucine patch superfamily enzyme